LLVSFSELFFFHIFADKFHRELHGNDTTKVHVYQGDTGTGSLHGHLLRLHAERWVQECQEKHVELRGKEGREALARATGRPVDHQAEAWVPFTQDNFLDGLVRFIVATDQVFFTSFFLSFSNFFF
jgi:hypothetical protein